MSKDLGAGNRAYSIFKKRIKRLKNKSLLTSFIIKSNLNCHKNSNDFHDYSLLLLL